MKDSAQRCNTPLGADNSTKEWKREGEKRQEKRQRLKGKSKKGKKPQIKNQKCGLRRKYLFSKKIGQLLHGPVRP